MSEHRNYITWVDQETNEQKSLIDELVEYDQAQTGGANKQHIEALQPHEQYAIYMSSIKGEKMHLTSVNEMFEDYAKFARERGKPPIARDRFIAEVKARDITRDITLVNIGDKEYFLGIGLKK